jgi:hypothetical protein
MDTMRCCLGAGRLLLEFGCVFFCNDTYNEMKVFTYIPEITLEAATS